MIRFVPARTSTVPLDDVVFDVLELTPGQRDRRWCGTGAVMKAACPVQARWQRGSARLEKPKSV